MDVRNRSELETDGKIIGSVNLPCNYTFLYFLLSILISWAVYNSCVVEF